eukprot:1122991-Prymnesium_polylepis.1
MPRTALGRARLASLVDLVSRARSILNTTTGYSRSRDLGVNFQMDESGGIGARLRLESDAELLARRPRAARRTQRAR